MNSLPLVTDCQWFEISIVPKQRNKNEHGISDFFLSFSGNQKDQLIYKDNCVLETRIQSRIPGTSFPFFELMRKTFPSSPVYPEGTNKVAEAHSEPRPTSLRKFVHEVKKTQLHREYHLRTPALGASLFLVCSTGNCGQKKSRCFRQFYLWTTW